MKKPSKPLAILLTLMLLLAGVTPLALAAPGDRYSYDQPGDKNYVNNTNVLERYSPTGSNNQSYKVSAPRAQANATFTTQPIVIDGLREAAWDAASAYPITNTFNTAMTATAPAGTQGNFRLLWDGPLLYILVEVSGDSTKSDTGTPTWSSASYTPTTDGLFVNMDVFNDQWGLENDTQGVFFLPANPAAPVTSYNNSSIPSLGSFFNPNNQDYSTRLKSSKSSGYSSGSGVNYTYEIALQIEGWGDAWARSLNNGTKLGLELGIFDQGKSFTYWSKTLYYAGNEGGSNLPNSERIRNRDWGEVTLSGWDAATPFAYSGWRADEDIRFWNSKSNPGGTGAANSGDNSLVWTDASKARMLAAKTAYQLIKDSPSASRAEKDAAVLEVCQAFAGLRWHDTQYPDPHDLPALNTLPNIWEFFDQAKGTNGMVTNAAQWAQRKQELLDLAQFYEYGYKPKLGVDYTISLTSNTYNGTGKPSVSARVTPTNVNFSGGVYQDVTISVTLPSAGLPEGAKAPVAFSGGFTANGIADITFPNWAADSRTDAGAWGNPNRSGTFYTLFPYSRNSTSADVSIEMANATAVSVYLDILQMAVAQNSNLDARIDPTRAVTKGFSINGKLAFVAAVFDERVKAVVAGGAGATGPANWRYNVQGQEYNFSNTIFYNAGAENIVAFGTEGPGNSYRHNRVRETELFRHFLPYGHEYVHEDGSYAYGEFSRLPFDNASLVATLAPDRAIIIDTNLNDYNDGAVTDNMSLEIAKSVYTALGVNADNYVKFNSGNYVSSGDPHGAASATPEGHYLSDLFYGTTTLTSAEASRLNTDPYNLDVSNGQTETPYDYYWGGFNTLTGGTGGVSGENGWYYDTFEDLTPPGLTISGATADGEPMTGSLPGGYILNTTNHPAANHLIQFAAGSSASEALENTYFGLYLTGSTMSRDALASFLDAKSMPANDRTYLTGVVNGTNPFIFIKGNGTTSVSLADGLAVSVHSVDADWTIPDDFPRGTYTLQGEIRDLAHNPASVTLKLIVAGNRAVAVSNDYDGDGMTDPAKFVSGTGATWWVNSSTHAWEGAWLGAESFSYFGSSDFDGDGITDPAKYVPSTHTIWWLKSTTGTWQGWWLGAGSLQYISGSDFDGDGQTDPAMFYPSTGVVWYVKSSTGSIAGKWLGPEPMDYISASDFDGDGLTDPAKFIPSSGVLWYLGSKTSNWTGVYLGSETFTYVPASDFDGDGKSDPAKFISETGVLWYLSSLTSSWVGVPLGAGTYTFIPGSDFNGDGRTDPARYDGSTHTLSWYNVDSLTWNDIYMGAETFSIANGQ